MACDVVDDDPLSEHVSTYDWNPWLNFFFFLLVRNIILLKKPKTSFLFIRVFVHTLNQECQCRQCPGSNTKDIFKEYHKFPQNDYTYIFSRIPCQLHFIIIHLLLAIPCLLFIFMNVKPSVETSDYLSFPITEAVREFCLWIRFRG